MKISFQIEKILSLGPIREGGRNPYVDWVVILFLSIAVILAFIFADFYLFKKVTSGKIQSTESLSKSEISDFDDEGLEYIIKKFELKAETLDKVTKSYRGFSDPSK